jgi:hypothetical protein
VPEVLTLCGWGLELTNIALPDRMLDVRASFVLGRLGRLTNGRKK